MNAKSDMSLKDKINLVVENQTAILKEMADESVRRVKAKNFKLPFGVHMKAKRGVKRDKMLCVFLGSNHQLTFKVVNVVGGLVQLGDYQYKAYENGAIYHYKNLPVIVALEWRLTLVGGTSDFDDANNRSIGDFAQQTIIRAIEKIEIDKEVGKGKKKIPIAWLVVGLVVVIYLVSKSFGVV